jgi:hypothetical protein
MPQMHLLPKPCGRASTHVKHSTVRWQALRPQTARGPDSEVRRSPAGTRHFSVPAVLVAPAGFGATTTEPRSRFDSARHWQMGRVQRAIWSCSGSRHVQNGPGMSARNLAASALLVLLAAAAACGLPPSGHLSSSSRTASPSSPAPQPTSAPPGYKAYVSGDLRYSFVYPDTWFVVGRDEDPPYFGLNVVSKDIGTPILLREHDIWFNLAVSTAGTWSAERPCGLPTDQFSKFTELKVSIDGVPASAFVPQQPGGPDATAGVTGPELIYSGWCYGFGFITTSVASTNEHLAEIEEIYSSFRFNR